MKHESNTEVSPGASPTPGRISTPRRPGSSMRGSSGQKTNHNEASAMNSQSSKAVLGNFDIVVEACSAVVICLFGFPCRGHFIDNFRRTRTIDT
jgi:hypothetical protein